MSETNTLMHEKKEDIQIQQGIPPSVNPAGSLINSLKPSKENIIKTLVISGGGFKGFSLIGVLRALEKFNVLSSIETYVGTSIGAVFAFLISIKYTHTELYDFITSFTYKSLADIQLLKCLDNYGLETGNKFMMLLRKMLQRKMGSASNITDITDITDITFETHYRLFGIKLVINATCVNDMSNVCFSVDTHPNLSIMTAIRASIAIPLLFTPVQLDNNLYVDGGLLENFLIRNYPPESTLGIMLSEEKVDGIKINTFESYILQLIKGIHKKINASYVNINGNYRIIHIHADANPINVNITKEERIKLYKLGYMTAKTVLSQYYPKKNLFEELTKE